MPRNTPTATPTTTAVHRFGVGTTTYRHSVNDRRTLGRNECLDLQKPQQRLQIIQATPVIGLGTKPLK